MPNHGYRTASLLTTIALLASGLAGPMSARAQERPVFKASVAVVPITAVVRNARNQLVRDLGRGDFQVREEGELRPIVEFRSSDSGPVSVAILFDTSGSMRGPNLDKGISLVDRLLDAMQHEADEVALFTFDKTLRQETPFTNDVDLIRCGMDAMSAWGLTSIYDAVADAADVVAERSPGNRRVVIVVTDGADTSSTFSPAEASARASAIDVPVYVIDVAPAKRHTAAVLQADEASLAHLAFSTGGDVRRLAAGDAMDLTVAGLMSELRQQYFLAIESAAGEGWRRLEVTTTRENVLIRARTGYFSTPG